MEDVQRSAEVEQRRLVRRQLSNAVSSSVASMGEAFASAEPASSGSSGFSGGGGGGGGWKKPGVW